MKYETIFSHLSSDYKTVSKVVALGRGQGEGSTQDGK